MKITVFDGKPLKECKVTVFCRHWVASVQQKWLEIYGVMCLVGEPQVQLVLTFVLSAKNTDRFYRSIIISVVVTVDLYEFFHNLIVRLIDFVGGLMPRMKKSDQASAMSSAYFSTRILKS
jgi:hypothetical protein